MIVKWFNKDKINPEWPGCLEEWVMGNLRDKVKTKSNPRINIS